MMGPLSEIGDCIDWLLRTRGVRELDDPTPLRPPSGCRIGALMRRWHGHIAAGRRVFIITRQNCVGSMRITSAVGRSVLRPMWLRVDAHGRTHDNAVGVELRRPYDWWLATPCAILVDRSGRILRSRVVNTVLAWSAFEEGSIRAQEEGW